MIHHKSKKALLTDSIRQYYIVNTAIFLFYYRDQMYVNFMMDI